MEKEAQYAALLLDWNRRMNLTGARTPAELDPHLQDARGLLAVTWDGVRSVIDIGSGGGLPAIPLALQLPFIRFTLLEANQRKVAFLQHVAGELRMGNVTVARGRAEDLARLPQYRETFDRAISRAAAHPTLLLELALPFIRIGGDLVAAVGEINAGTLEQTATALGGGRPWIEHLHDGRALLRLRKEQATPARFPRRPNAANRRPPA